MVDATISVITYKRPLWLKRLLESLSKQKISVNLDVDILVVDNASDKETEGIVNHISSISPYKITYSTEATPGIVSARNKCVTLFLASSSKNLFFIDDDEWPKDDDWAQKMLDKKELYSADIVTSHILSVGEEGTPEWAVSLIYGENALSEGDVVKIFYTNNLLLSRKVVETITPAFDSRFVMTGASDYHFALKCSNFGFKAVYINAPVVEEFPKSRATIKWFVSRGFRSGIGYTRAHFFEDQLLVAISKGCIMSVVRLMRGIIYLFIGCITLSKLKIVDGLFRLCSSVGTIAGFFGIKHNEYKVTHGK